MWLISGSVLHNVDVVRLLLVYLGYSCLPQDRHLIHCLSELDFGRFQSRCPHTQTHTLWGTFSRASRRPTVDPATSLLVAHQAVRLRSELFLHFHRPAHSLETGTIFWHMFISLTFWEWIIFFWNSNYSPKEPNHLRDFLSSALWKMKTYQV